MGAPCVLRRRGWLKKCFAHTLPPDFRAKNSTGRSPICCLAFVGPFSFPNSLFSSQLHPFRTLKVQWGTLVFLRRRVGSRSVRYRWIFVLKHHRTRAIFWGVLSAVMPTTASRIWLKKRTRHRNPRHFLGGSVLPRPGKKPARGTPKKLSQLSLLSLRGVLPLKSCHRPPWATPKVVTVVTVVTSFGFAS